MPKHEGPKVSAGWRGPVPKAPLHMHATHRYMHAHLCGPLRQQTHHALQLAQAQRQLGGRDEVQALRQAGNTRQACPHTAVYKDS